MELIIHVDKLNNNKSVEKEKYFSSSLRSRDGEEQTAEEGCHQLMEGVNKLTDGKKTLTEKETYGRKEAASRGRKTGSGWRLKNNNKKTKKQKLQ